MANSFFKFKQFTIHQDRCAMKVCTDACLFGALLPRNKPEIVHALEIGAGTGLLSLMFAQHNCKSIIDAVEIDEDAFHQAQENIKTANFESNFNLMNEDVRLYKTNNKYDLIFSNPPFYLNDLKSKNNKRNLALHSTSLSFIELLQCVNELLKDDGLFYVLIPFSVESKFLKYAYDMSLYEHQIIRFRQSTSHGYFRSVIVFSKIKQEVVNSEIVIKESSNDYSNEFKQLLKDYYLFL